MPFPLLLVRGQVAAVSFEGEPAAKGRYCYQPPVQPAHLRRPRFVSTDRGRRRSAGCTRVGSSHEPCLKEHPKEEAAVATPAEAAAAADAAASCSYGYDCGCGDGGSVGGDGGSYGGIILALETNNTPWNGTCDVSALRRRQGIHTYDIIMLVCKVNIAELQYVLLSADLFVTDKPLSYCSSLVSSFLI